MHGRAPSILGLRSLLGGLLLGGLSAALLAPWTPIARAADGVSLPLPTPSLAPLPTALPTSLPLTLPAPVPGPVTTLPPVPGAPGLPAPGGGEGDQPAASPQPGADTPAPSDGPAPAAQPGFAPTAGERSALPYEPPRLALEGQQWELQHDQGTLDDVETEFQALGAGGGLGDFAWPFALRHRPPITQRFGCTALAGEPYSPSCATGRFHTGVDFGVPAGTSILASRAGVARTFSSNNGYGNYVLLVHGNGWYTLYAHLSRILVSDGQVVGPRQQIGQSGSTGFSTGPHLHFEVRRASGYLDPCLFLPC